MLSATELQSLAYGLTPAAAAKAATDELVREEQRLIWARAVQDKETEQWAEDEIKRLKDERDQALPPTARLKRLKEQRDEAERQRLERQEAVDKTEQEIYALECRLHDERADVTDVLSRLEVLDASIDQVELLIPPAAEAGGPSSEAGPPRLQAFTQHLMQAQMMLTQLHGGDLPTEFNGNVQGVLTWLDQCGGALDRGRRDKEAQVASDEKMAQAIAAQEAKEQSTEADVNATGEHDFTEVGARGRAKKGKSSGKGWSREHMPSPTVPTCGSGPDIGPLATLGRQPLPPPPPPPGRGRAPRAASEPRGAHLDRRRSPRRQMGGGTPANPTAGQAGQIGETPQAATGSPTGLPSAPPEPAVPVQTEATAAETMATTAAPGGHGSEGAGADASTISNSGGRSLWT